MGTISPTDPRTKQRLNFDFAPDRAEELKKMASEAGCTMKDLLNNALSLLEWSIDETKKGNEIGSLNESSQQFRVLMLPLLQRVKKLQSLPKATSSQEFHAVTS